ncbi:MAG: DUF4037 domain-containing protein [Chitinophagaceae bacterium]|nr:DUF4037 domain-containing protein [Anaerolineae bacterium]
MADFIPGLKLGDLFFHEAVKPLLESHFPALHYAAALIGSGSEILGFDTVMSSDHHWGPRAMLFLSAEDKAQFAEAISGVMAQHLPHSFYGYPTNFAPPDPKDNGTQLLQPTEQGTINHRVEFFTVEDFVRDYLGFEWMEVDHLSPVDWLTMTGQKLRTVVGGAVYQDGVGDLTNLREKLAYYPHDVWLYLLAAGWARIGQEEPFMGRTGSVDDELGSRLIAARLVHDLMNLCFLMEKQYAPYSKWFGTAFSRLKCAPALIPIFEAVLSASTWQQRESHLSQAYHLVAEMHNALHLTPPLSTQVSSFFDRPFQVIHGDKFVDALLAQIQDPAVRQIAQNTHIGAVDQFSTSTDFLSDTKITRRAKRLYAGD